MRDAVEHDGRDDLVDTPGHLEHGRNRRPRGASDHAREHDDRDVQEGRKVQIDAGERADEATEEVLPLGAYVENPGLEGEGHRDAGQ